MTAVPLVPARVAASSNAAGTGIAPRAEPTAAQKLATSRARMRDALERMSGRPGSTTDPQAAGPFTEWLEQLKSTPAANVVIEAVNSWWAQHPMRMPALVALGAARSVVLPMAQRNPLGLMLGALLLGGLLAWSRPWRWALKSALFAGLLPLLISKAIARMPINSWLDTLGSLAQKPSARPVAPLDTPGARPEPGPGFSS
jgi:hypothetical protein